MSSRRSITTKILPEQRQGIRDFLTKYWFVKHKDVATMFGVSRARISEIFRSDSNKGGV